MPFENDQVPESSPSSGEPPADQSPSVVPPTSVPEPTPPPTAPAPVETKADKAPPTETPNAESAAPEAVAPLPGKGDIVEVTVRRLAPFGAFVRLTDGRKGLIHISQITDEFVDDVKQHLQIGQVVRARITGVSEGGKVDVSIKKAKPRPKPTRPPKPKRRKGPSGEHVDAPPKQAPAFHVNPLADILLDVEKKLK